MEKSTAYALVFNGKVIAKGSKRDMLRLLKRKQAGYPVSGLFLGRTTKAVGASWTTPPTGLA
jgi:hypothetical protein